MADSATLTYGFVLPEVSGSQHTWGGKLNDAWDDLDVLIKKVDPNKSNTAKATPADSDTIGLFDGADNLRVPYSGVVSSLAAFFDDRYDIAEVGDAEEGTDNVLRMTPYLTKKAIEELGPNPKDNWGSAYVYTDATLTGKGTAADPLARYVPPAPVITAVTPTLPGGDKTVTITGTAEPSAVITLYRNGSVRSSSINANGSGNWSYIEDAPTALGTYTYTAEQYKNKNTGPLSTGFNFTMAFYNIGSTQSDVAPSGVAARVELVWNTDGTVDKNVHGGSSSTIGTWLTPAVYATDCYIRITQISGTAVSGATGTWLPITVNRSVRLDVPAYSGLFTAVVKIELSLNGSTVHKSQNITMSGEAPL